MRENQPCSGVKPCLFGVVGLSYILNSEMLKNEIDH